MALSTCTLFHFPSAKLGRLGQLRQLCARCYPGLRIAAASRSAGGTQHDKQVQPSCTPASFAQRSLHDSHGCDEVVAFQQTEPSQPIRGPTARPLANVTHSHESAAFFVKEYHRPYLPLPCKYTLLQTNVQT